MSAPTSHAAPATTTGAAVDTTQRQDTGAELKAPTGTTLSATTSGTPATTTTSEPAVEKENVAAGSDASAAATEPEGGYPEQAHAGKLGYGPSYAGNSGIADQLKGTEEKIKGKLFHKPELVQQGEERKAGILAERKHDYDAEHEESAFDKPVDQKAGPPGGAAGAGAKDNADPKVKADAATAGTKEKTA
ncbi:hypothetical protein JCM10908_000428 [Rhodotorula pacifica]|uniref:uncharacterized protein n=1 Tax=Rhodotorula pacifica TaxID=1495444 RepID=UPI00316CC71E